LGYLVEGGGPAQRVELWQRTGERPSVAVWTTEQTATFLGLVANDRLAVMWWLIATA
jgi:hypothetical protein